MLYGIAIFLGIAAGVLVKGRISGLAELQFRKGWLILAAFIIQVAAQVASLKGLSPVAEYSIFIQAVTYCMLLAGFWFNREYLGMLVIGGGCVMNFLVTMVNGGRMPVNEDFARSVLQDEHLLEALAHDGKHLVMPGEANLAFLSDIMHPPGILSFGMRMVSIGDLVVVGGLLLIVFEVVSGKRAGLKRDAV